MWQLPPLPHCCAVALAMREIFDEYLFAPKCFSNPVIIFNSIN
jgi:hypothetical protein